MKNNMIVILLIIVTTLSCSNESKDYYVKTYYLTRYYLIPRRIVNTVFYKYYGVDVAPNNDTIVERKDTIDFHLGIRDTSLNEIVNDIDIYLKKFYSIPDNRFYPITSNICLYKYKSDTLAATEPFFREIPFEFDLFLITYYEPKNQIVDTIGFSYFAYANKKYNCLCLSNKYAGINKFLRKIEHIRNDSILSLYDLGSIPYQCAKKQDPFPQWVEEKHRKIRTNRKEKFD